MRVAAVNDRLIAKALHVGCDHQLRGWRAGDHDWEDHLDQAGQILAAHALCGCGHCGTCWHPEGRCSFAGCACAAPDVPVVAS